MRALLKRGKVFKPLHLVVFGYLYEAFENFKGVVLEIKVKPKSSARDHQAREHSCHNVASTIHHVRSSSLAAGAPNFAWKWQ